MSEKTTSTVCYIVIVIDFSLISFFFFFFLVMERGTFRLLSKSMAAKLHRDLEEKIGKMRVNKKTIVIRKLSSHITKLENYICLAIH